MWLLIIAVILVISTFFAAYLTLAYTNDIRYGTFAEQVSSPLVLVRRGLEDRTTADSGSFLCLHIFQDVLERTLTQTSTKGASETRESRYEYYR